MTSSPDIKYDTIYEIDARYRLSETDANLDFQPESYGTRRVGVAVIGVGRMGAIHLYNVLREPRAKVLYVLDSSQKRLDHMNKKYFLAERGVKVLHQDHWQTILDDQQVEAVLISTPTYDHEHYTRSALEHNKNVLCEKPLADSIEAVEALAQLAIEKNLKLICAFQRRYDPSFRRIAAQAKRGDIGQVRIIKTCSRDSPMPPLDYIKISGGIFHDCLVHDVDVILWIANELPIEVHSYAHAYSDDYRALGDYDTALVSMKFKSGLMSSTDLSRVSAAGYEQRIEVYGPNGVLKLDELPRAGWEKHTEHGRMQPSQCYSFASRYIEAYPNEIVELLNHIEGNKTMEPIRPGYLVALCKIVQACEDSARAQRPVKLNWSDDDIKKALS